MDLELKDKVAVVTGGSIGIGLAIAHGLAAEGVHIALCARNEACVMQRAKELAGRHKVQALGVGADVSRAGDISTFAAAV